MRWKLLIITSITAALAAFCLWEVLIHFVLGPARPSQPHYGFMFASALVPVGFAAFAGFFVYRHTSRRRKTQAAITMLLTLMVGIGSYVAGSKLYPELLGIPVPCDYPCK